MPQPIAILAHWRTGSTLLQDTLAKCGMVDCRKIFGTDGIDIDNAGADIYHGFKSKEESATIIKKALIHYKLSAEINNLKFYGIKINHALQKPCWKVAGPLFKEVWPDAKYIISTRDPSQIVNSVHKMRRRQKLNPEFTDDEIVKSWESTFDATKELIFDYDAQVITFPNAYINGDISKLIKK